VPPLDVAAALADVERRDYEQPLPMEHLAGAATSPDTLGADSGARGAEAADGHDVPQT